MRVTGISYADGNFFWVFQADEMFIIAQNYCSCTDEFLTYNVNGKAGQAYTVNKIGERLANGQILTKELYEQLKVGAKVQRSFYLEGGVR